MAVSVNIPRRRFGLGTKTFLADQALPANTDRIRLSLTPDASDRTNVNTRLVVEVYGAGNALLATSTLNGTTATAFDGHPIWPWTMTVGVVPGQPLKVSLSVPNRAFFASGVVSALQPGDV